MDTFSNSWEEQWAMFCPHFNDGKARVNLSVYGGVSLFFDMLPGAGFGDLSHATTKLCLKHLCQHENKTSSLIDIGCGSGVLSLAASVLGFSPITAIDIDDHAIHHTKKNIKLNDAKNITVFKHFKTEPPPHPLVMMNMISSEQLRAWESVKTLHSQPKTLITSGILTSQKASYLASCPESFGKLILETSLEGWCLFIFKS